MRAATQVNADFYKSRPLWVAGMAATVSGNERRTHRPAPPGEWRRHARKRGVGAAREAPAAARHAPTRPSTPSSRTSPCVRPRKPTAYTRPAYRRRARAGSNRRPPNSTESDPAHSRGPGAFAPRFAMTALAYRLPFAEDTHRTESNMRPGWVSEQANDRPPAHRTSSNFNYHNPAILHRQRRSEGYVANSQRRSAG